MKALTIMQPHATLIAEGVKDKETRGRRPPDKLIGERFAIHAGMKEPPAAFPEAFPDVHNAMWDVYGESNWPDIIPYGAIVATARLAFAGRVVTHGRAWVTYFNDDSGEHGRVELDPFGDYAPGRWIWFLDEVRKLDEPYAIRGKQGFWEWEVPHALGGPSMTHYCPSCRCVYTCLDPYPYCAHHILRRTSELPSIQCRPCYDNDQQEDTP